MMEEAGAVHLQDPGGGGGGDPADGMVYDDRRSGVEVDQRRVTHNITEKRRKDKIKQWISQIAQLLPPNHGNAGPDNRPSTLDIMERAAKYISQLKSSLEEVLTKQGTEHLVGEMKKMRNQIDEQAQHNSQLRHQVEELTLRNIQVMELCRAHGVSVPDNLSQWKSHKKVDVVTASTSTSSVDETLLVTTEVCDNGNTKKRSRRPGTVIAQLEQQKLQEQQQALLQQMSQNGSVMSGETDQYTWGQMLMSQGQMTDSRPQTPPNSMSMGVELISPCKGGPNILEAAIQSSGIKDSHSPAPGDLGDSRYDQGHDDNLQTLASVASNTASSSSLQMPPPQSSGVMNIMQMGSGASSGGYTVTYTTVTSSPSITPIMSVGHFSSHQAPPSSQSGVLMGMNLVNSLNQNGLSHASMGQNALSQAAGLSMGIPTQPGSQTINSLTPGTLLMTQNNQVLIINENGNPVPFDPNSTTQLINAQDKLMGGGSLSLTSNALLGTPMSVIEQQQALISSGALTLGKGDHSASGLAALGVSQSQASLLSGLNSQMAGGMNFLGPQILAQNTLGQLAIASGNQGGAFLGQQQLLQSLGMQFPGMITGATGPTVGNAAGNQTAQQALGGGAANNFIFPTGQTGMLLNSLPTSQTSMPTALVLPSGQVIPVVSNPQLMSNQAGGIMTGTSAGPAGAGPQTALQIPQLGAGQGAAGQILQTLDSTGCVNNPQIFIGPNGIQVVQPQGQGPLTQQQLQQLLQQQQQPQNLGLLIPSLGVPQSATLSTPSIITMANTTVTAPKPAPTVRATLAAAKVSAATNSHANQRTVNSSSHHRSHSSSAASRKAQQPKSAASSADVARAVGNSVAGVAAASKAACVSAAQGSVGGGLSASSSGMLTTSVGGVLTVNSAGAPSGAAGNNGPMVLVLQRDDGQLVQVLYDSKSSTVLHSAHSPAGQSIGFSSASSSSATVPATASLSSTPTTTAKKAAPKKGSASQRAIFPKPKSKASAKVASVAPTCAVTTVTTTSVTTAVSTPLVISTDSPWGHVSSRTGVMTDMGTGGEMSVPESQDILATAAASIFQTEEISPPIIYSPTHDDNRLMIDVEPAANDNEDVASGANKKVKLTPVMAADRCKKAGKPQEQQRQLQESNLLQIHSEDTAALHQTLSALDGIRVGDSVQQLQDELSDERKLRHYQEQSDLFSQLQSQMGLGDHPSVSATTPVSVMTNSVSITQSLSVVPPSVPTMLSPISEPSPAIATVTPDPPTAASLVSPATVTDMKTCVSAPLPAKKPKKSKKKKDKEREAEAEHRAADIGMNMITTSTATSTEPLAETAKPAKKSSRKRKKGEEVQAVSESELAQKRREEINRKQQQLLLEEQQKRKQEEELRQHQHQQQQHQQLQQQQQQQQNHADQLMLLQQQQQEQQQAVPSLLSDPQLFKTPSEEMEEQRSAISWIEGDRITFSSNDLSLVLDQVENLVPVSQHPLSGESSLSKTVDMVLDKEMEKTELALAKKGRKPQEKDAEDPPSKKARKSTSAATCVNTLSNTSAAACVNTLSNSSLFGMSPQALSSDRLSVYDFQADSPPGFSKVEAKSRNRKSSKNKAAVPLPVNSTATASSPVMTPDMSACVSMALSANTLDSLFLAPTPSKPSPPCESLNTPKPKVSESVTTPKPKSKSKKEKKSKSASSSAATTIVPMNSSVSVTNVNGVSESLATTMTSSKSNDSISTIDSVSVIMPSFDTLESLSSPAPLISPPITSHKSSTLDCASKNPQSLSSSDPSLGHLVSVDTSEESRNVIAGLPDDISEITGSTGMEAALLSSPQPPVLHHPLPTQQLQHQQQKQPQQQQQSSGVENMGVSQMPHRKQPTPPVQSPQRPAQHQAPTTISKPHQQASPRQTPLPQQQQQQQSQQQQQQHNPSVMSSQPNNPAPQPAPPQCHAQMGPPTSPAQAVGRPRSATSVLTHQTAGYPSSSPQAGGYPSSSPQAASGMHQSPSAASCISPSASNHSRSSLDSGFGQGGGSHLASSPSASRMTDISTLLGGNDLPCPNANLFAGTTPKMSRVQKPPTPQQQKMCAEDVPRTHSRAGIYSADNFLAPSGQSVDPRTQSTAGMGRLGINDVTGDFSYPVAAMSMTSTPSQIVGQDMGVASSTNNSFSFSLTSATTTQMTTSVSNSVLNQSFSSFYPPQQTSGQLPHQSPSLSMLSMPSMPDLRMDAHSHQQQNTPGPMASSVQQNAFSFGGLMDINSSCSVARESSCARESASMRQSLDKSPMGTFGHHTNSGGSNSGSKHMTEITPQQTAMSQQNKSSHSANSSNTYFPSQNFASPAANLTTSPLRHPPLSAADAAGHMMNRSFDTGFGTAQASGNVASYDPRGMAAYQKDLSQTRPLEHVSSAASSSSRKPASQQQQQQQQQQQGGGASKQKQGHSSSSSSMGGVAQSHNQSRSMTQNSSHSSQRSNQPTPAHQTTSSHAPTPGPNHQNRSSAGGGSSSSSAKRNQKSSSASSSSSSSQSKKKPVYAEADTNLSHNIFDSNQGLSSLFFSQNMASPPPRNMQTEPSFLTSNFFGPTSRPLSTNPSNKNAADLGPPYSMLPPSRAQNGIGFNFQHGFSMQAMGNHGGGPMTPHSVAAVTPHMSNFALGNFLSDSGDSGLNISPIKFSHHTNPILQSHQAGMDPNSMQVHQGGGLYHNPRSHHGQPHLMSNAMALFSQHPHGFDTRSMSQGINSGVGTPFHGGHPSSFMPPLNFSHDH